ncbi:MAG: glycosyltransferase family 39 protein [bacterium]|nr:glycosyltransferase family 39 protein [bacterium]
MNQALSDFLTRWSTRRTAPLEFMALHALLWGLMGLLTDIHPDMADHWVWSRKLGWGYYEHPPMVALTMAPIHWLGMDPVLGLKWGSALFSALILGAAWLVAREVLSPRGSLGFLLLLESTAYFSQGSVFWHIDQPFMLFWIGGLWALLRLVKTGQGWWMLAFGIFAGLGAESKYIMAFLPLGFGLYLAIEPSQRWVLKHPATYLGGLACLGLLAPNLYWNAQHDWITLNYNFKKGLTGGNPLYNGSLFLIGHILLFSPYFAPQLWRRLLGMAWGVLKKKPMPSLGVGMERATYRLLLVTGLTPMVVFTLSSLKGKGSDPHWVNLAYLGLFVLLVHFLEQQQPERLWTHLWRALALNGAILLAFNLALHTNPFGQGPKLSEKIAVLGWEETAEQLNAKLQAQAIEMPPYVVSREYWLSGALSLYLPQHPWPYTYEKCQHNLWTEGRSSEQALAEEGALMVCYPYECPKLLENMQWRMEVYPEQGCVRRPAGERPQHLDWKFVGDIRPQVRGFEARRLLVYLLEPRP